MTYHFYAGTLAMFDDRLRQVLAAHVRVRLQARDTNLVSITRPTSTCRSRCTIALPHSATTSGMCS